MEIKQTVTRYGASGFMFAESDTAAMVQFEAKGYRVRFIVPLPDKNAAEFRLSPGRKLTRTPEQRLAAWEQAGRQRWRALALVIKAKLEAVESGITEFQSEFLAHIVLPNGQTVGEWALPQVDVAIENGTMPPMLPMPRGDTHA